MRIIAHTKYGVFTGVEEEFSPESYVEVADFLGRLCELTYFAFRTATGKVYMTKEMVADSLFILEK